VVAVSVDVPGVVPLMVTEVGERLHCVPLTAAVGEATVQDSVTVPLNEFEGVTVMVDVLPVVAAGLTEIFPLLVSVKLVLPPGASQKSPQPARIGAANSNSLAHFPIVIASLCEPPANVFRLQGTVSARAASSVRRMSFQGVLRQMTTRGRIPLESAPGSDAAKAILAGMASVASQNMAGYWSAFLAMAFWVSTLCAVSSNAWASGR
jgi:hypothetical protein